MHTGSYGLHCVLLCDARGIASKGRVNRTAHTTSLHYRRFINVAECIDTPSLALRPRDIVKVGLHMGRTFSRVILTLWRPRRCGSPRCMEKLIALMNLCCDQPAEDRHTSEKEGSFPGKFCSPG
jgi:hypothetical protein